MQNNPLVSIIVPVYNVENFIEKCATTLFEQDYDNIEYIFVNDCTPDSSISVLKEIIEKYPNRKKNIKITNNIKNQGSSLSRKIGLDIANGEYILFVDSDDWVELDMVSSLVKEALNTSSDIVIYDYYIVYMNKKILKTNRFYKIKNINNIDQYFVNLLCNYIDSSLPIRLYKKQLFYNITFPNFSMGEDTTISLQLFYNADKISYLNKYLYYYNKNNTNSICSNTKLLNKNINDLKDMNKFIINFLNDNNLNKYIEFHYQRMCYIVIQTTLSKYKDAILFICPEANKIKYIWKNKKLNLIKKIIYSFPFVGLGAFYEQIVKLYIKMRNKTDA